MDLTWVRFISGRRNAPYHYDPSELVPGSYHNMHGAKPSEGYAMGDYSKLDESKVESLDVGVNAQNRYSQASGFSTASDATITPSNGNGGDKLDSHGYSPSALPAPSTTTFNAPTPYVPGNDYQPYTGAFPPRVLMSESGAVPTGFVDPYASYGRS